MIRNLALVAVVAVSPCAAQTKSTYSPPDLENIYTGANNGIPFGGYQSPEQLYQQVDSSLVGRQLLIGGMELQHSWSSDYEARSYAMEVSIGDAATTPATISDTYTANFAGTPTVVFSGSLNWPARSRGFTLPGPYDSPIPFSNPYSYSGAKPICWETYISKDSLFGTVHYFMAGYGKSGSYPTYWGGTIGAGCYRPGANPLYDRPLTSHGYVRTAAPATYKDYVTFAAPNAPVVLKIGVPTDNWGGAPLPLSLGFVGAPACNLYIAPLLDVYAGTTDSTGRAEVEVPFPFGAASAGFLFRSQWIAFDSARTRVTSASNGLHLLVPYDGSARQWEVSRNWGTTFGTTKPQKSTGRPNGTNGSRSGFNEPFYGLVVRWRHF